MKLPLTHYGRILIIGTLLMSLAACRVQPPSAFITPTPSTATAPSALTPTPEAEVPLAPAFETDPACSDYSNIKGGPATATYYWRFHLAFNTDPNNLAGCLLIRRAGENHPVWGEKVPCQFNDPQSRSIGTDSVVNQEQITVTADIPELPQAGGLGISRPLTYTTLDPGQFISCTLSLNEVFSRVIALSTDLGITTTLPSYTYSYFSFSALTYLPANEPYKGNLVEIRPSCALTEPQAKPCMRSLWSVVASDQISNAVSFQTQFNDTDGDARFETPSAFEYDPSLIQGWWVGIRSQFDRIVNTDTIKLEHLHDQSFSIGGTSIFMHRTTTYGQKSTADTISQLVAFSGDPVTIYIGGSPDEPTQTFNGGIVQIMIDPSGGSSPDGGM